MKKDYRTCKKCDRMGVKMAVVEGTFGHYCSLHLDSRIISSDHARFLRHEDRESHKEDIIQPWRDGEPNPEFLEQYPDQAKDYYSKEEIEKMDRDY